MPSTQLAVHVNSIENGMRIPERFAYCISHGKRPFYRYGKKPVYRGVNISPAISWSGAPRGTKSYVVSVVDNDMPINYELFNKPNKTIPSDSIRYLFYNWILIDIPENVTHLPEGSDGEGGINGQNDYGYDLSGNELLGYNGPCPPWNDERLHKYYFTVYALDVKSLNLKGNFDGRDVEKAMAGHILAKGDIFVTYTMNTDIF